MKTKLNQHVTTKRSRSEGSVFITVLVVLFVVSFLALTTLRNSLNWGEVARRVHHWDQAQLVAEAGLEDAARRISESIYLGAGDTVYTYTLPGVGSAQVTLSPLTIMGNSFAVTSVGTYNGTTRTVKIDRVWAPTYGDYGLYVEQYGTAWFTSGQLTTGKVFLGTNLRVQANANGGPIFRDEVEVAGVIENYSVSTGVNADVNFVTFDKGYETGVSKPPIGQVDFSRTELAAQELQNAGMIEGMYLEGETTIRFFMKEIIPGLPNGDEHEGYMAIKNELYFGDNQWHEVPQDRKDLIYVSDYPGGTKTIVRQVEQPVFEEQPVTRNIPQYQHRGYTTWGWSRPSGTWGVDYVSRRISGYTIYYSQPQTSVSQDTSLPGNLYRYGSRTTRLADKTETTMEMVQTGTETIDVTETVVIPPSPGNVTIHRNKNDTETGAQRYEGYVTEALTVYSENDIKIEGHIRLWDDPLINPAAKNKLMLVASDDVQFDSTWRSDTADLVVQAAAVAVGQNSNQGEIGVVDYDSGSHRGNLWFTGPYVAEEYGYSGTFYVSDGVKHGASGYSPHRTMDYRFVTDPPPFAPVLSAAITYAGWHNP